jgi:hypothetical protein
MMLEYDMRLRHPFPYDTDPSVRLGQQIGDALFVIIFIFMVWGLFLPLVERLF